MKKKHKTFKSICLFVSLFLVLSCSGSDEHNYKNSKLNENIREKSIKFMLDLKTAVKHDNKKKIADMVQYPSTYIKDGEYLDLNSKKEFLNNYDHIFNDHMKKVIKNQKIRELDDNWTGIKIGDGEAWYAPPGYNSSKSNSECKLYYFNSELPKWIKKDPEKAKKMKEHPFEGYSTQESIHRSLLKAEGQLNLQKTKQSLTWTGYEILDYDKEKKILYFKVPKNLDRYLNKHEYRGKIYFDEDGYIKKSEVEKIE